jgi:hypothetical protein
MNQKAKSIGMETQAAAAEVMQAPPVHAGRGQRVQVIGLEAKPEYNDELGTVISWEAAKQRAGVRLDSGASLSLRPANLRPAAITQMEPTVSAEAAQQPEHRYEIVGPVCESGDFLASDRPLRLQEGSLLAIMCAGAYGYVMASNYNARPRPPEVLVDGNAVQLARPRERIEDLFATERPLPDDPK